MLLILRISWTSFGWVVTRFAWIANKFVFKKRCVIFLCNGVFRRKISIVFLRILYVSKTCLLLWKIYELLNARERLTSAKIFLNKFFSLNAIVFSSILNVFAFLACHVCWVYRWYSILLASNLGKIFSVVDVKEAVKSKKCN